MSEQRGRVRVEPAHKRVRAYLGGELVVDTTRPLLVWEIPYYPAYYVPGRRRAHRSARPERPHRALAEPGRGAVLHRQGRWPRGRRTRRGTTRTRRSRSSGTTSASSGRRWTRGSRRTRRCSSTPAAPTRRVDVLHSSRHVEVARQRREDRRDDPPDAPVRDRACPPATTSRRPTCAWTCSPRPTPRPAAPTRASPTTGRSTPATTPRGPGLVVPRAVPREPEDRRARVVLQREGRPRRRRRGPGAAPNPVLVIARSSRSCAG